MLRSAAWRELVSDRLPAGSALAPAAALEESLKGTCAAADRPHLRRGWCPLCRHRGIALQVHQPEPRTTLDIDLAVLSRADIPRRNSSRLDSPSPPVRPLENWLGPGDTPVRVTDNPALAEALGRAEEVEIGGVRLRILGRADLLHEKLRAGADPARRRSKRLQDLADAQALLEVFPELASELSAEERARLDELPG